jgi:hypothetical protein
MRSLVAMVAVILAVAGTAQATGVVAATNYMGYKGTIWNITDGATPVPTATPRDGLLYFASGGPADGGYNQLMSNLYQHQASSQADSFLQLIDSGNLSVTSASGSWDPSLTVFSLTVTGHNAPYPWSRMWQPDNQVAWGVTFTDYAYAFTATFADPATPEDDGFTSSGLATSIVGNFSGQFVVTDDADGHPITGVGDTYGFNIDFNSAWFDPDGGTGISDLGYEYGVITPYSAFSGPAVPEPISMAGLMMGVGSLVGYVRRRARN